MLESLDEIDANIDKALALYGIISDACEGDLSRGLKLADLVCGVEDNELWQEVCCLFEIVLHEPTPLCSNPADAEIGHIPE